MIQVGLAVPRRAARLAAMVLAAAFLRALLLPLDDFLSTSVFGLCLLGIAWMERPLERPEAGWGRQTSIVAGLAVGLILLGPVMAGQVSDRLLSEFWGWAAMAAVIASLEELVIRGALYRRWLEEAGPTAAIVGGAVVFALIHLPRYGLQAMPLDLAVGLALGGLRTLTGRVLPCAVAHTIADWGAWFWA